VLAILAVAAMLCTGPAVSAQSSSSAPPAAQPSGAPSGSQAAPAPQGSAAPQTAPGQAPPAGGPPAGAAPGQDQSKPTFRMAIDVVSTDVIARDNNGQFVADLNKDDFEIYEDGVRQEIATFTLVHGGRVINQLLPPPPPPQEGIILPATRPTNDTAGRIFLFFVDDLHLNFRDTSRLRQLFKKISETLVHDGDMFGIVSTGPSSISVDLTYDRKRLEDAMNKMSGSALKPSEIIESAQGPNGPSELLYRAHVAFSTAYDIVRNLEKIHNRRKAVVYVSNGYDFNPFEGARFGDPNIIGMKRQGIDQMNEYDPFTRSSAKFAEADLVRELAELTRAANRANATLYTIDPRGLVAGADLDEDVDPTEWNNYVRKSQDSLRVLADETGGFAVVNQNDFDKALKRIDAETSDYYVVGYYSTNPDPTKRNRKLEIKTTRKGVNVWSRTSYSLRPPPEPKKSN
jgi:VWFA-related protein